MLGPFVTAMFSSVIPFHIAMFIYVYLGNQIDDEEMYQKHSSFTIIYTEKNIY